MAPHIETLLQRIEDGTATAADLDDVRAALDAFAWEVDLPGAVAGAAEPMDVADAVLAELGIDVAPVGRAVRAEAGDVDISASVLAALALDGFAPVAAAVLDEAGTWDDAGAVLAALDLDLGAPVAEALAAEAGAIDIADAVMGELQAEIAPVAEALRFEAGSVDVADAVMASLAGPKAMPAPTVAPVLPAPANNTFRWAAAMLAAAMVALVLGIGGMGGMGGAIGSSGSAPIQVAGGDGQTLEVARELLFASASEVQIEDLSFGDDVVVFQDEGDDGALILWIDDEEVL